MSVRVIFEIGHEAVVREKKTAEGYTHNWELFIRGADNTDIQHFVDKVVFYLHETFLNSRRDVKEPPYSIRETGYAGFNVLVEVHLKNKPAEPSKIRFNYYLNLQDVSQPQPLLKVVKERYVFPNPSYEFRRKLIKGGGVGVNTESSFGINSSHMPTFSSHSVDQHKNSYKNKSQDVSTKKLKKDSTPKHDDLANENQFSMLFGQPIIKNEISYSTSSKSNSKSISDKLLQQPEKQARASSKSSKHNSSPHEEKDEGKEKEKNCNKQKLEDRNKEKDKNVIKNIKYDGTKKATNKDDKGKIFRTSKEESKKNSFNEEKSKEKVKSIEKFVKEVKQEKKEKEKKHKDNQKLKVKQEFKVNENKKENLGLHEHCERTVKFVAPTDVIINPLKEKKMHKNLSDRPEKTNKEKTSEQKYVHSNTSVNNLNLNPTYVVSTFDDSKKEEKHKNHKHKKDKLKKIIKRDKEEKKDKVKESKELKEKSPSELLKCTAKLNSPKRHKKPLKKLFEELIDNSDSDTSSLDEDIKVSKISDPKLEPGSESSSSDVAHSVKEEPVVFSKQEDLTKPENKKDKKSAEEKEVKKRKHKFKYENEGNAIKIGKYSDTDGVTEDIVKHGSRLSTENSTTVSRKKLLPVSETRFTDEYITNLKELQRKIMSLDDHTGLQRIVQLVAETGQYEITTKTFDFDLCSLDESIVQRLLDFFVP